MFSYRTRCFYSFLFHFSPFPLVYSRSFFLSFLFRGSVCVCAVRLAFNRGCSTGTGCYISRLDIRRPLLAPAPAAWQCRSKRAPPAGSVVLLAPGVTSSPVLVLKQVQAWHGQVQFPCKPKHKVSMETRACTVLMQRYTCAVTMGGPLPALSMGGSAPALSIGGSTPPSPCSRGGEGVGDTGGDGGDRGGKSSPTPPPPLLAEVAGAEAAAGGWCLPSKRVPPSLRPLCLNF